MAYAQFSHPAQAARNPATDLWSVAHRLLAPFRDAHRRLLLRQQLEGLSDRLLTDAGIAREDLPALLRQR